MLSWKINSEVSDWCIICGNSLSFPFIFSAATGQMSNSKAILTSYQSYLSSLLLLFHHNGAGAWSGVLRTSPRTSHHFTDFIRTMKQMTTILITCSQTIFFFLFTSFMCNFACFKSINLIQCIYVTLWECNCDFKMKN